MKARHYEMFNLNKLNYKWIICFSMLLFGVMVYIDRSTANDHLLILYAGYWISFGLATVWGIINYISHIQYNVNVSITHGNIEEYVNKMRLPIDEAQELKAYLADYATDLAAQYSITEKDARIRALNEFNIKEIHQLNNEKNLFTFMDHTYLFGYATIFLLLSVLLSFIGTYIGWSNAMVSIISMLVIYFLGFVGMYILYKFLDAIFINKLYGGEK